MEKRKKYNEFEVRIKKEVLQNNFNSMMIKNLGKKTAKMKAQKYITQETCNNTRKACNPWPQAGFQSQKYELPRPNFYWRCCAIRCKEGSTTIRLVYNRAEDSSMPYDNLNCISRTAIMFLRRHRTCITITIFGIQKKIVLYDLNGLKHSIWYTF